MYFNKGCTLLGLIFAGCKPYGIRNLLVGEMEDDLQLMLRNATNFNEPGSQIYKDAK